MRNLRNERKIQFIFRLNRLDYYLTVLGAREGAGKHITAESPLCHVIKKEYNVQISAEKVTHLCTNMNKTHDYRL